VAPGQKIESSPLQDPVLGPALALYDDRSKTLGGVYLSLALFALGILGLYFGAGDLIGGNIFLGGAYVLAGLGLGLYGVRGAILGGYRVRNPLSLIVGRDGFRYAGSGGSIGWDEVASVGDPGSPPDRPRVVRVQLVDWAEYMDRHGLSWLGRIRLRANQNDLFLSRDTVMPIAAVQALMRRRLDEFRGAAGLVAPAPPRSAQARARARRGMRRR
jgi:hypothetical protein